MTTESNLTEIPPGFVFLKEETRAENFMWSVFRDSNPTYDEVTYYLYENPETKVVIASKIKLLPMPMPPPPSSGGKRKSRRNRKSKKSRKTIRRRR
jgi:hypothetical protein